MELLSVVGKWYVIDNPFYPCTVDDSVVDEDNQALGADWNKYLSYSFMCGVCTFVECVCT
jgi:hypothetical protein